MHLYQWFYDSGPRLVSSLGLVAFLTACGSSSDLPNCDSYLANQPGNTLFESDGQGLTTHIESGTVFYRCVGGQSYRGERCFGSPLVLDLPQTQSYLEEFSVKTQRDWRLPTQKEIRLIHLDQCQNPAVDTRVFPNLPIDNLWTGSQKMLQGDDFQCVMYTFNGSVSCRHFDSTPLPFLMVLDES